MASEVASSAIDLGPRGVVARNAVHLVVGQATTTALAVALSAVLGRALGAADFGLFFLISASSTFAYVVVDWGQQFHVVREVARSPHRSGLILGSTLALRAAGGAFIAVPVALISRALGHDVRTCWYSAAFVAASLPFAVAQGYTMVFRGRDRMDLAAGVSVANKAVALVLTVSALGMGMGLAGAIGAQALAGAAAIAVAALLYRWSGGQPVACTGGAAREIVKGGSALVAMMLAVSVQPYLDALILARLAPPDSVGWYGAARTLMGTLVAPSLIIGAASFPRISRAAIDPRTFNAEMRSTLRPMLVLGALASVGTWTFAEAAITLVYGRHHFDPAGAILRVYAPCLFVLFVDVLFANALTAAGKATSFSVVKVVSIAVNVGLDFALVPYFQARAGSGGLGIVVAALTSEIVVFAGAVFLLPRAAFGVAAAADTARALAAALATALLFHWLPPLPLYAGIPACVVAFALCALCTGVLRPADVSLLAAVARRRERLAEHPSPS